MLGSANYHGDLSAIATLPQDITTSTGERVDVTDRVHRPSSSGTVPPDYRHQYPDTTSE